MIVIGPHWPAEKFSDIWTSLMTQISAFEHRRGLTRGTSPLRTATTQQTDEVTELMLETQSKPKHVPVVGFSS